MSIALTSAEDSDRNKQRLNTETRAIRMLHAGDSTKDVSTATGLTRDEVERLRRDFPGPARRTAQPAATRVPQPVAQADAGRACDHLLELPIHVLTEHPANIRTDLGDPVELEQLAQSIREQGILQPLVVMRRNGRYVLLAGHRRLAAALQAGLARVPITIRDTRDDPASIETMLVENLQRARLEPLDEAEAYRVLIEAGRTQAQIARAVGKPAGHISARLALLNLNAAEREALRRKEITTRDGYLTGRDRSNRRRPDDVHRPKPKRVPHFTKAHPLAHLAALACDHETTLKLGVACGPCWETVIRADQAARTAGGDT